MAKKVLLIEDEKIITDLLQKKLVQSGYEVLIARSGEDGLKMMEESVPNLVLLDIMMFGMSGFDVLEKKNENRDIRKIPVIIISNSGQPVEIDKAKKLGAKDWLVKTEFDPQEVLNKIKKQIG